MQGEKAKKLTCSGPELRSEIQTKLRKDTVVWLENQCQTIGEFDTMGRSKKMYDMIKSVKNYNTRPSQQACIKDEDGIVLEQKEDILNRWKEYGAQLFGKRPKEEEPLVEGQIPPDEQEPSPLVSEVKHAVK